MASFKRTAAALVVCLIFVLGVTEPLATAFAQDRGKQRRGKKKENKPKRFQATGTIDALLPEKSIIKFTLGTKESWLVELKAPKPKRDKKTRKVTYSGGTDVQVTGTALRAFLRPGMFVRFSAAFDAKGRSSDKVDLITIFTPNQQRKLGIFREGFTEGGDEPKNTTRYLVAGQLASFKKGRMSVVVPGRKIKINVAEDATFKVDVNNASLARPGDKIEVKGHYFQKGWVRGEVVTIELSQPLGVAKKKTSRSRRSSSKKPAAKKPSKEEPAAKDAPPKKEQDSEKKKAQDTEKKKPQDGEKKKEQKTEKE